MAGDGRLLQGVAPAPAIGAQVGLAADKEPVAALGVHVVLAGLGGGEHHARQGSEGNRAGDALYRIAALRALGKMRDAQDSAAQL